MIGLTLITILTILSLILSIIFIPELRIKHLRFETFWLVSTIGAFLFVLFNYISLREISQSLTAAGSINPIKILVIFITVTILSVVLDELGFFRTLAYFAVLKAGGRQMKIFLYLYITVSILTVFTSNDIVVLTFTPFICYFCKWAKINPLPYLIGEFVAANTWSMFLIIGNPTNIYLATANNIDFLSYFKVMALPTIISSLLAFGIVYLIFRKSLKKPIEMENQTKEVLIHKHLVVIAVLHLFLCTILFAVASYIHLEMWMISLTFALSILTIIFITETLFYKIKPALFIRSLRRAPWTLIPFVISMFVITRTLSNYGVTNGMADILTGSYSIYKFGISAFLSANILNNIPMSILYSNILAHVSSTELTGALFASIIASNIGAFLTPIGALAGIMWMRMLNKDGIPLSFVQFMKYGVTIAIPTLLAALFVLTLVI